MAERHHRARLHYGTKLTTHHALIQDCIRDLFLTIREKRPTMQRLQAVQPREESAGFSALPPRAVVR